MAFQDLSFFLVHTGNKLATHHHLQTTPLPHNINALSALVDQAELAFNTNNSVLMLDCINDYHQQLKQLNLVAPYSLELISKLSLYPETQAIKGCGALGADIVLILCTKEEKDTLKNQLIQDHWNLIATEDDLYKNL